MRGPTNRWLLLAAAISALALLILYGSQRVSGEEPGGGVGSVLGVSSLGAADRLGSQGSSRQASLDGAGQSVEWPRKAAAPKAEPSGQLGSVLIGGTLSYVSASYGPSYLALPFPRGTVATICAVECVTRRSTDYGPDQRVHPDRIADLSASDFERVCDFTPAERVRIGLCKGTVELEPPVDPADDRMRQENVGPTLPATDSE